MQIIVEVPQDPTDLVLQGAVIGDTSLGAESQSRLPWFVLQGELGVDKMPGFPVPRAMIGQHDWYGIKPRTTGPKVMSGGECVMLDIGAKPVDPFVDPIQRWLNSVFQVDKAGFMMSLYDAKTIGAPEAFAQFMVPEPETMGNPMVNIPRGAVYRSGLAKRTTMPVLPDSFGRLTALDSFVESSGRWRVAGVTRDGAGAALGSCRVVLMESGMIVLDPARQNNPIVGDATSDGSGNYSIAVGKPVPHQAIAYLAGSPDVAGVTVNTVIPTEA
jgi:hypothetical protein